MNSTLKSFLTRTVSAFVALLIVILVCYYFKTEGLIGLIVGAILTATFEFTKIIFKDIKSLTYKILFFFSASTLFLAMGFLPRSASPLFFPVIAVFLTTLTLMTYHKKSSLPDLLSLIARAVLGLFYVGMLPATSLWIAQHPVGIQWFIFLLAVVFSGDTFAYLFGVLFGKTKIMPTVSPKKSLEGALGGLLGSAAAGSIFWYYLTDHQASVGLFILTALIAGFCGQFGDFFESLIKRVADVKDSGKIMPGHGGILDRIDAVLFASPVILLAIYLLGL